MSARDTIFALATPFGASGVAMVRASGPQAWQGLQTLAGQSDFTPRQARLLALRDPATGALIDRAVALPFRGPESFTGEDIVEYQIHGSPAVIRLLLAALGAQQNHRPAEPGEFTRRAFENGKMDLTAAEAVADLIHAETEAQRVQALRQMDGALARLYEGWRDELSRALAHLEADIDFPDEDLPGGVSAQVLPVLEKIRGAIGAHLDDNRRGERLRDGLHIVIAGAPNAGKSSLLNALVRREVAIVSPLPGTTRDVIEAPLDLGGYPVILADTAGLRPEQIDPAAAPSHEGIEAEGMRRARQKWQQADIRILMFDATALPALDPHTRALAGAASLIVFNKTDEYKGPLPHDLPGKILSVSARTGAGLADLSAALVGAIESVLGAGRGNAPALTRARHRQALEEAAAALDRAFAAPLPELRAEDARLALRALGRLTGRVDVEDLLDIIFRDFCIGK